LVFSGKNGTRAAISVLKIISVDAINVVTVKSEASVSLIIMSQIRFLLNIILDGHGIGLADLVYVQHIRLIR